MRRGLMVGLLGLTVVAAALPPSRTAAVDLVSRAVPWTDPGPDEPGPEVAVQEAGVSGSTSETSMPPRTDASTPPRTEARPPADDVADEPAFDGPPPDLEISDDLPIPPLAPGVGALEQPAARPASATGPHWVPFTGNRILWCVYRGAGRCNGHHPYPAIDVDMAPGTPIYAAGPGTVYQSCGGGDACGAYGSHVRIVHLNGVRSIYAHFRSTVARTGQTVRTGTLLGYSGCTGRCNGAHLHYEERNGADQSIQIGQMQGYVGRRVVTYPNVWGYSSWTGLPPDRLRIRNDFFPEDDRDDDTTPDKDDRCVATPGVTWAAGCPLPLMADDSGDAAVRDGAGNLRHHAVGEDGRLWQLTRFTRGWQWTDRGQPGVALATREVATAVAEDGSAWVFAVDDTGLLWSGREAQGRWLWTPVGVQGAGFPGVPAAAAGPGRTPVAHAVDAGGSLWRAVLDPTGTWSWTDLGLGFGGVGFAGSTPSSFLDGEGRVTTAIADADGRLHRYVLGPTGGSGVTVHDPPGTGVTERRPALLTDRAGLLSIFSVGRDGHLWRLLRSYWGSWVWIDHGAIPGGDGGRAVTAWRDRARNLVVGVIDGGGRLRTSRQATTIGFGWGDRGARGPLSELGEPSSAVMAGGTGQFLVSSGGEVHRTGAVAGGPWTVHPR